MKNKKSLLSLGLLALVLVLGVGYAVVSEVGLTFGGSATVADAQLKVDIIKVEDDSTVEERTDIKHTLVTPGIADTFTIEDMVLGEVVTITYTVKNHETDVAATLSETVELTNSNEEYYDVDYSITNPNLAAGGETTVVVTVTLTKTPVSENYNSTTIGFALEAAADDNHQA